MECKFLISSERRSHLISFLHYALERLHHFLLKPTIPFDKMNETLLYCSVVCSLYRDLFHFFFLSFFLPFLPPCPLHSYEVARNKNNCRCLIAMLQKTPFFVVATVTVVKTKCFDFHNFHYFCL